MAKKIIVFDSGIGGFSILRALRAAQIPVNVTYVADQEYFPYGNKSDEWLVDRMSQIAGWGHAQNCDAFVIACNTGTVAAIKEFRHILGCPVIGVEPVIKPLSGYERSLVLATNSAVASPRTRELLATYGSHIRVFAPQNLASAVEYNDEAKLEKSFQEIKDIVDRNDIQAIGLSCTHYPLVLDRFKSDFPGVALYDPSRAVVAQIKRVLGLEPGEIKMETEFVTTGEVIRFNEQLMRYFGDKTKGAKITI